MIKPPKLPNPPVQYDKTVFDRIVRSIEQVLDAMTTPGPRIFTSLRLTGLPGTTLLNTGVNDVVTSFVLNDASGFADSGSGTIENEKFSWTSKTGNTLNGVTRGILGTTAASHLAGVVVVPTAVTGAVYAHPTNYALYVVF